MGFQLTLTVDVEYNPNAVGEALRSLFFDEKTVFPRRYSLGAPKSYRETGCYTTFDWQADVEELEPIVVEESTCSYCQDTAHVNSFDFSKCSCTYAATWTRSKKVVRVEEEYGTSDEIECRYWWDGDGTLIFILPDGSWLVNEDCKKDHDWSLYQSEEHYNKGSVPAGF